MMIRRHAEPSQEESFVRSLLTLVLLVLFIAGGGAFLDLVGGPPHVPSPFPSWSDVTFVLRGSEVPSGVVIYVTTTLGWLVLGYMVVAILLRVVVDLLGALARENPLAVTLRIVSDGVTIPIIRRVVDGVVVAVLVGRLLGPDLGPTTVAAAPIAAVQMSAHPNGHAPAYGPLAVAPAQPAAEGQSIDYLVKRGDTLRGIAARFLGDEMKWPLIWEANRGRTMHAHEVFTNPDHIEPSWELTVPVGEAPDHAVYVVRPGDALWSIAEHELGDGMRWREIWALNEGRVMDDGLPFSDPRLIEPGWRIFLPTPPTTQHEPPPATTPVAPRPANGAPPLPEVVPPARPVPTPSAVPAPSATAQPATTTPLVTSTPVATPTLTSATKPFPAVELPDGRLVAATFGAALFGLLGVLARRRLIARRADLPEEGHVYHPGRFLAALRQRFAAELETDKVAILANRLVALLHDWGEPGAAVVSCLEGRRALTFTLRCDPQQAERLEEMEPIIRGELRARTRVEAGEDGRVTIALSGLSLQAMLAAAQPDQDDALPLLVPVGATADRRVLHLNLAEAGALLVAGQGSAPTELLRDLTMILAAQAHPRQLALTLLADPRGTLEGLRRLPHLAEPLVDVGDRVRVQAALAALQGELARRIGLCQSAQAPTIATYNAGRDADAPLLPYLVVAIAGLEAVARYPGAAGVLATLAREGPTYGIVVVAATAEAESVSEPILDAFPTRLAARLADESRGLRVLGQAGAEELAPEGELLLHQRGQPLVRLEGLRLDPAEVAECVQLMAVALGTETRASEGGTCEASVGDDTEDTPASAGHAPEVVEDTPAVVRPASGAAMHLVDPRAALPLDEPAREDDLTAATPPNGAVRAESPPDAGVDHARRIAGLIDLPISEEAARTRGLLRVYTLGRFRVLRGDAEITGTAAPGKTPFRAKARELFAYCITQRDCDLGREQILADLWAEVREDQAQRVFHNTLWVVRSALNAPAAPKDRANFLVEQDGAYRLAHGLVWIDAREFVACVERAEELEEADPELAALLRERAVRLYQGDYLENQYADWASTEQTRLRQMYLRALKKLADHRASHRQLNHAIVLLAKAAALEPFEEEIQRKLLQLYATTSDWEALARQYTQLEETLKQEMGVAPERKTRDLYQRLQARRDGRAVPPAPPA